MNVCVYVLCMYVCMYECMYVCMHVCMYVCMCVMYVSVCIYVCTHQLRNKEWKVNKHVNKQEILECNRQEILEPKLSIFFVSVSLNELFWSWKFKIYEQNPSRILLWRAIYRKVAILRSINKILEKYLGRNPHFRNPRNIYKQNEGNFFSVYHRRNTLSRLYLRMFLMNHF